MSTTVELGRFAANLIDGGVARIAEGMFGVIALSDSATAVRAFNSYSATLEPGLIRWPGGTLSERGTVDASGRITVSGVAGQPFAYDLKHPDLLHPSLSGFPGLTQMLAQADRMDVPFSMILPTGRYEGNPASAYTDTMAFLNRMFVQGSFSGGLPPDKVILEIGNENYDPAGYGAVAAEMLRAVRDFRAANPNANFDVALQSMQSLADTYRLAERIDQLGDQRGGSNLLAEVDIVRTHFLSQGLAATSIVEEDRSDPTKFDRIETLSSLLRAVEAARLEQPGRQFDPVEIFFSAWTVSSDDVPGQPSMGLPAVSALISLFSGMAELGVDLAAAWGVGTRNPMSTTLVLGDGQATILSPAALALDWMREHLPGTNLVQTAGNDGTRSTPYNTVVFEGTDHVAVLVSANNFSGPTLDVSIVLSGRGGFGSADGVLISQQSGSLAGTQSSLSIAGSGGTVQFSFTQAYQTALILIPVQPAIGGPEIHQRLSARLGMELIHGGGGNDTIVGSPGNDTLYGEADNDSVLGGAGNDLLFGGEGADYVSGGAGNDQISGDHGQDTLYGDEGDDSIDGGEGNDQLFGGLGADTLLGAVGNDSLAGNDGADVLRGGAGDDTLLGGAGNDLIHGDEGKDQLNGDEGDDTLIGNSGADFLWGGGGADSIFGGDQDDRIGGGLGNDQLWGGAGRDEINGGEGADRLYGDNGPDLLKGGSGNDTMWGGAGNDTLLGELGADRLFGGAGADTFVFSAAVRSQRDTIADFEQGIDRISITQFSGGFGALQMRLVAGGVEVNAGGALIFLEGQSLAQMDATDFLF